VSTRIQIPIERAIKRMAFSCLLLLLPLACLQAAEPTSAPPKWIFPVVPGFGGVHPRADLPVRPDPKLDYKIFVDVASEDKDDQGRYDALDRLARLVNLMAYAKVPPEHVHIVALLDGRTGYASLTDDAYKNSFKTENPNLPVLHALKKAGVTMMVCGQALAMFDIPDGAIDPAVTITLSALTDNVVYGQKGYIFMRL
jgi:intracellular sulfur oxidation DsrE/DsrF family protein